ncbi:MAG: ligase-associated DNA damage response DEXH box helicase, partial [Pseudomonadota bacterium]
MAPLDTDMARAPLPPTFEAWFEARGWRARPHQLAMVEAAQAGRSTLLIAPTGGGKTLAGFLPSLIELADATATGQGEGDDHKDADEHRLHTLYISPLKALAVDVARNLMDPIAEMGLPTTVETRTGDTPVSKRQRQRTKPPHILLTTPEQMALLLAHPSAETFFGSVKTVVLDELHALVASKRGDLLSLGLARLRRHAPAVRFVGLSATVHDPEPLRRYLVPQATLDGEVPDPGEDLSHLVIGQGGARAMVDVLASQKHIPWSGHMARHAMGEVLEAIKTVKTALVFVNTRSQAEICFQELWRANDDNLPIALHHGSLDVAQRRKVEAAMTAGGLRAVVCTSTLDLGIDWGDVDLVIQIGAPKGASRLTQRIGRANHRLNEASRALLVPGNRFEVLECRAAKDAVEEGALDGEPARTGALDILAQHIMGMACAAPFDADALYAEIVSAAPYSELTRETFDQALAFVSTGGYALKRYDRYKRLVQDEDGRFRVKDGRVAQQYRMNVGAIIEAPSLAVRLTTRRSGSGGRARAGGGRAGRKLGTIEEWFVDGLTPGDTFLFSGQMLRFEGLQETDVLVTRAPGEDPKAPSWQGGKFPLSTYLADRVRKMIDAPETWSALPAPVAEWLELQAKRSAAPKRDELLVETFPYSSRHFLVCYPFDGRLAHQTLGMLATRRLERLGMEPLGFVPTEYALSIWSRKDMSGLDMGALFEEDLLGDDLESWLAESVLMKRTFRYCAQIAGLIERRHPGQEKTGRQVAFSSDLIYDVLKEHEPDHLLLKAAWADAASGFLDLARLAALLRRCAGRVHHRP